MSTQRGFTLIEVLVASTIFVGVLVIGVSSFSSINRLNEQIVRTRRISQTGNFVMETLVRDIRSATGLKNSAGQFGVNFPFDFIPNPDTEQPATTSQLVPALKVRHCTFLPCDERLYRLQPLSDEADDLIVRQISGSGSLLPAGIGIKDLEFNGISHQQSTTVQPYVTIKFTLVDLETLGTDAPTEQTFQTTVTSLVYSQ